MFTCKKCEEECEVEFDRRDPNDCVCYCETCNDYAEGFDSTQYASDYMADLADAIMDRFRDD